MTLLATDRSSPARLSTIRNFFWHECLYLSWAMMEVALLTPILIAFMPWGRFWPPLQMMLWLLLVMLIPFNLSRLMGVLGLPVDRQRIVLVVGLLATSLLAVRMLFSETDSILDMSWLGSLFEHAGNRTNPYWIREVTVFISVAFMWWRGISLVGRRVDIGEVGLRFRVGVLLAAPFVAGLAGSQLDWSVTPFILLFYSSALVAIVLTRVQQLERIHSGHAFPMGSRWLVTVLVTAAVVALVSAIVVGIISGRPIVELVGWLAPVWLAMNFTVVTTVSIISYLSAPLFIALGRLLTLLASILGPALRSAFDNITLDLQPALSTPSPLNPEEVVGPGLQMPRQLLPLLVLLFFALLVSLALGRVFRPGRVADIDRAYAPPLDVPGHTEGPGFAERLLVRLGVLKRWRAAASIRRIYLEMCIAGANLGFPRMQAETPYEYLESLSQAWPNGIAESTLITEAYVRVRYGEIPESREELNQIREAWRRLRQLET